MSTILRSLSLSLVIALLWGCGVESAGTAASVAKLEADQAKQAKEVLDSTQAKLEAAAQQSQENLQRAEKNSDEN